MVKTYQEHAYSAFDDVLSAIMAHRQRLMGGFKEIKLLPGWLPVWLSRLMYYYAELQSLVKLWDLPDTLTTEEPRVVRDRTGREGTRRDGKGRDGMGRDENGRDGTRRDGMGRNDTRWDGTRRDGMGRDETK